jgi:hypothetical protein
MQPTSYLQFEVEDRDSLIQSVGGDMLRKETPYNNTTGNNRSEFGSDPSIPINVNLLGLRSMDPYHSK